MGSTQPREYNWEATWKKKYRIQSRNLRIQQYGLVTLTTWRPLSAKVDTSTSPSGGRSIGIVRSRAKATEFLFCLLLCSLAGQDCLDGDQLVTRPLPTQGTTQTHINIWSRIRTHEPSISGSKDRVATILNKPDILLVRRRNIFSTASYKNHISSEISNFSSSAGIIASQRPLCSSRTNYRD
jgi:hypothetical protein